MKIGFTAKSSDKNDNSKNIDTTLQVLLAFSVQSPEVLGTSTLAAYPLLRTQLHALLKGSYQHVNTPMEKKIPPAF